MARGPPEWVVKNVIRQCTDSDDDVNCIASKVDTCLNGNNKNALGCFKAACPNTSDEVYTCLQKMVN